ncbi:endo alpha-1,4 polygalactosaminidase [Nocardiopsis exhalans]|uniref:Endo alpha-1,4 polygalactosaminidase n=1 Tax=Nocardiopsis exhalans TaxID=163604 RepID=A0ABY5DDH2_9ACTN|nr:endo alpha-1,4 polygalactosaminidase [Nocardiopsis exhalans]USY22379.1 endo alpha-1,4 polygalactosaminidase [Nocardiopsis exhalans]
MVARTGSLVGGVLVLAVLVAGCAVDTGVSDGVLPGGGFDYQLGGAYPPAEGVTVVVRDSTAEPARGRYSVCYVNGFQTQPGDLDRWLEEAPDLLLRDGAGAPVTDPGWPDEILLDTSTGENRQRIAAVLAESVDRCADAGFDAVEFDNLDSHLRSGGALTMDDNLALAGLAVALAHDHGLDAAQKNAAEEAARGRGEAGFDFAVAESCAAWSECAAYTDAYGSENVLAVEYPEDLDGAGLTFDEVCADPAVVPRTILRDLALVDADHPGYLYERC